MKKLDLKTNDLAQKNIEKIKELFPEIVTEYEEDGKLVKGINIDKFKEVIGKFTDKDSEFYELSWVGKQESKKKIVTPINKTLRPVVKDSVDFENTENLYIEGDNFEVLKLLQESYLNKIKMIYIDPPYNTGTAMIYANDFSNSDEEYNKKTQSLDKKGNKLFENKITNGRFHSNWLSMMYERLVLSKDLLKDNGFIAIAIDHNELNNLTIICDEIFSEDNRIGLVTVVHKPEGRQHSKFFSPSNEFMLVYTKEKLNANFNQVVLSEKKIRI